MIATAYIRDCIINPDKTRLIHDAIAAGTSQYGMQTFDQSLFDLYSKQLITIDEALARASNADRKSTRLNSSHGYISYAVFCLKKKKKRSTSPSPSPYTPSTASTS